MIDREKVISNLQHINTLVTIDSKSPAGARYSQPLLLNIKQWTEEALELINEKEEIISKLEHGLSETLKRLNHYVNGND